MRLYIDSADIEAIKRIYEYYPVHGVTTNPTILYRAGKDPYKVLKEIKKIIGADELFVQVVSTTAEEMVREAKAIRSVLGAETIIKVPVNREGLKALKLMKKEGIRTAATAIYTLQQAYLACQAGAGFIAPYVNRITKQGHDGIAMVKDMQAMIDSSKYETRILAASFREVDQLTALVVTNVFSATVAPDLIEELLHNSAVDEAVDNFNRDFEKLCGPGATMRSIK